MVKASTVALLRQACAGGYAIGAFNVIGIEHAEAVVCAAEQAGATVILQLSQNAIKYHFGQIEPIGAACAALARAAGVPVALHLDHAQTADVCERAIAVGFDSVMFDASALAYEENVRETAALTARVHTLGAGVEAELGVVGGKDGFASSAATYTDPQQAAEYVAHTGVDTLAVAVGSTHGMVAQTARLDVGRIDRLRRAVSVPLVLHGASGVPDDDIRAAIAAGISKVNYATQLNVAFTASIRASLGHDAAVVDPRPYLREARQAMIEIVRDRIRLVHEVSRRGASNAP